MTNAEIFNGSGRQSYYKNLRIWNGAVDEILAAHGNTNSLEVLLTHGHVDHANGSGEFVNAGIPVYLSEKDRYIYLQHSDEAFRKGGLGMEEFEGHGMYVEAEDYIPSAESE